MSVQLRTGPHGSRFAVLDQLLGEAVDVDRAGSAAVDQAHLVRNWQQFTGLAPKGWIAHEFRIFQVTGVEDPTSLWV